MGEIKHTPWRVVAREVLEDGSVYPTHIVTGPNDVQVCVLESSVIATLAIKKPEERWGIRKETADLIAAAPELLEALKELVRPYGVADVGMVSAPGPLQMEFIAAVRQAKDAIAKASGAQS